MRARSSGGKWRTPGLARRRIDAISETSSARTSTSNARSRTGQAEEDGQVGDVGDPLVAEPVLVVLEAAVDVHLVLDAHDGRWAMVVHRARGDVHELVGC